MKYLVTLFYLRFRWAYYKNGDVKLCRRWSVLRRFHFATKKEAMSCLRQHVGYYVKGTLRREVK